MKTIELWWQLTKMMFCHPKSMLKDVWMGIRCVNSYCTEFHEIGCIEYLPTDEYAENEHNVDICDEGESWYAHHIVLHL